MQKFFAVILPTLTLFAALNAEAADYCDVQFPAQTQPIIVNQKLANKARKLCFSEFAVIHSGILRTPIVVGEHLTRDRIQAALRSKRENTFHTEDRLPANERADLSDYKRSGFDRGHMAPFKDMATKEGQYQSFSLANMIPQNSDNNQNIWEAIESTVRDYVLKQGEVYVLTGPLFEANKLDVIGRGVYVPTSIYKVVYDPAKQAAAAYVTRNVEGMAYEIISVAELEGRAGLNLLPGLPAAVKNNKLSLPAPKKRHGGARQQSGGGYREVGDANKALKAIKYMMR